LSQQSLTTEFEGAFKFTIQPKRSEKMPKKTSPTGDPLHRHKAAPKTTFAENPLAPLDGTICEIKAAQGRIDSACLAARHAIGMVLNRDYSKIDTAKQLCITSRLDFWETLEKRVGINSRILRQCMAFAKMYDESDVDRLIEQRVTWTHVVHLLNLPSDGAREAFLRRVAEEGLTAADLQREIDEKYGNRRPGSGKQQKPPEPPKSLSSGLKRALEKVSRLNAEHEHALFAQDFDLAERIQCEPPDEITEEIRDQLDRLIREYRVLATTAPDNLRRLEQSRPRIDRVFAEREKVEAEPDKKSGREPRSIVLTAAEHAGADRTGFPVDHALAK